MTDLDELERPHRHETEQGDIVTGIAEEIPMLATEKWTGIAEAVRRARSQRALADKLGVKQQAISKWLRRGYAPELRAVEIEQEYGIPRAELISPRLRDIVGLD